MNARTSAPSVCGWGRSGVRKGYRGEEKGGSR